MLCLLATSEDRLNTSFKSWLVGVAVLLATLLPLIYAASRENLKLAFLVLAADILGVALARFCFLRAGSSGPSEVGTMGSESGTRKHKARRLAVTTPEWLPMVHAAGMACGISAVLVMCYLAYQFDL